MKTQSVLEGMTPQQAAEWMIAQHGTGWLWRAVWRAMFRRKPARRPAHRLAAEYDLPDALRRDIGLPELPPRADRHPTIGPPVV